MKFWKYMLLLPLAGAFINSSQAQTGDYNVPFYNVSIPPGEGIGVMYYDLNPEQQMIYCYDSNHVKNTTVFWYYGGEIQSRVDGLPIKFKATYHFPGEWIDKNKPMAIANCVFPDVKAQNQSMLVSCEYVT